MKIEIKQNEKTVVCDMKVKGKDILKLTEKIIETQGKDGHDGLTEYLAFLDKLTASAAGLTVDELNDLDCEEKEKLTGYIMSQVQNNLGFSRLLSR